MKQRILTLLFVAAICFSSCQKDAVAPSANKSTVIQKVTSTTGLNQDTVAAKITGYLRLQLAEDATNTDNILIDFNPDAKTAFVRNEDAPTFQGFGAVSLSSLSSDNVALAINALPLTAKGISVPLQVSAKTTGIYKLNMLAVNNLPSTYDIWLKDSFKKDSLDFRNNQTYAFNLNTTDASTYGSKRFSLVIRLK